MTTTIASNISPVLQRSLTPVAADTAVMVGVPASIDELGAQKAAAFASTRTTDLNGAADHMPAPKRAGVGVQEFAELSGAAAQGAVSLEAHGLAGRATLIANEAFRLAVDAGVIEAPERSRGGSEFSALRVAMDSFVQDATGGNIAGLDVGTSSLRVLRESAMVEDKPALSAELDKMLAMNEGERSERSNSDATFALLVMLMTLLMEMAAADRKVGADALIKSEAFVAAMGERMVSSAQEHRTGAVIALATAATIAAVGVGVGAMAANRNVQSIKTNERGAIANRAEAGRKQMDLNKDVSEGKGISMTEQHQAALEANQLQTKASYADAKHGMNFNQNSVMTQGGQSLGQLGQSSGAIAQADADVRAAEETRIQENLRKTSEVAKSTADNETQRGKEGFTLAEDTLRLLAEMQSEMANTANTFTQNMA